ncbi:MAG: hypothetical protein MK481_12205 [SAR324 cluster bacterium]|nr:hypothetical protein [SAR324 cluster bacterium]
MQEDPRLNRNKVHFPRLNIYEKIPVLSATIHQDIKRPLFSMSERTVKSIRQITDEILYTLLVKM